MFSFTPETIYSAWLNLKDFDAKVGGLLCILACTEKDIAVNKTYEINGSKLRERLSYVFDWEYRSDFNDARPSYVIFAYNWYKTFFSNDIKKTIDLLSCAVFFLRRHQFQNVVNAEEITKLFIESFNLQNYKELWFDYNATLDINFSEDDNGNIQKKFYSKIQSEKFASLTFNSTLKKYAYDLSAAGHIQTLYSAKGILKTCLYSDESLDKYYLMQQMKEGSDMPETKPFENFDYKVFDDNEEKRYNRIVFGAPGTGKSHRINNQKDSIKELDVFERVTFHPNYSYSQFVGTYKPVTKDNEDIAYMYVEGPFMRLLTAALENAKDKNKNDRKRYLLIIEEINRANVASVFGDMFQLLDRDKDGVSEYEIQTSEDVRRFLVDKLGGEPINYKTLKLPNNFYIWATMNSADQGVFPMDTAFKRRWEFEYIDINKNADKLVYKDNKPILVPIPVGNITESKEKNNLKYSLYKWNDVREKINEKLSEISSVSEDKLLGPFFINLEKLRSAKNEPQEFIELFKSKVLMYLFEDVVKISPTKLFEKCGDHPRYSKICSKFDEIGCGIFGFELESLNPSETEPSETANE